MNKNRTPRPQQSAGSTQSTAACKASAKDQALGQVGEDGRALLSPEQHQELKRLEALQERARIDRLRKEANERFFEERKYKF